jgi:RND family efflux transporter MFP subunit
MSGFLKYSGRVAVTTIMVALGVLVCWRLWIYYMEDPWTRDGRVRADVVAVAPDVSGLVSEVLAHDNETVKKGQALFRIDPVRFELALRLAEATVASNRAALDEAIRESRRFEALTSTVVTVEKQEQVATAQQQAQAVYDQSAVARDTAKLNLERSTVVASVPGRITNFDLLPGNYANAGQAVMALVATETLRVEGYFEETKLDKIHVGDPASVKLLGNPLILHGYVESISGGIEDRERSASTDLLANITPTFSWVRLAQRVPVRIRLQNLPADVQLTPGRTATVSIDRDESWKKRGLVGLFTGF